jgi:uncharacterized protein YjbI with pentapeptide repeats
VTCSSRLPSPRLRDSHATGQRETHAWLRPGLSANYKRANYKRANYKRANYKRANYKQANYKRASYNGPATTPRPRHVRRALGACFDGATSTSNMRVRPGRAAAKRAGIRRA